MDEDTAAWLNRRPRGGADAAAVAAIATAAAIAALKAAVTIVSGCHIIWRVFMRWLDVWCCIRENRVRVCVMVGRRWRKCHRTFVVEN